MVRPGTAANGSASEGGARKASRTATPLSSVKGVTSIEAANEVVQWAGRKSVRTFHIFINETNEPCELLWFHDTAEEHRGTIEPGSNLYIGTYTFNQWKVKGSKGQLLGVHAGQSATVTIRAQGCTIEFNHATADADDDVNASSLDTPKGRFSIRAHVLGLPVWAFECVPDRAVQRLEHVATQMLGGLAPSVLQQMLSHRASLAIFGRDHVVSDVPSHSFMRYNVDRNLNKTSRGLGGTPTVPVTSCAEENLTMEEDKLYPCQSILVHELGHAVQNLGMDTELKARVQAAYTAALQDKLYPEGCYIVSNDHEYWATGTEAWFESTIRVDVNGGVNTRDKVRSMDPRLAALLAEVYGDRHWRYHHDCPVPLSFHWSKGPAAAAAAGAAGHVRAHAPESTEATLAAAAAALANLGTPAAAAGSNGAAPARAAAARAPAAPQQPILLPPLSGQAAAQQQQGARGSGAQDEQQQQPQQQAWLSPPAPQEQLAAHDDVASSSVFAAAASLQGQQHQGAHAAGQHAPAANGRQHAQHDAQHDPKGGAPLRALAALGSLGARAAGGGGGSRAHAWALGGHSNPFTACCPGARMYPSEGLADMEGVEEEGLLLAAPSDSGALAPQQQQQQQQQGDPHSPEVIAILSSGRQAELAVVAAAAAHPPGGPHGLGGSGAARGAGLLLPGGRDDGGAAAAAGAAAAGPLPLLGGGLPASMLCLLPFASTCMPRDKAKRSV